MLLAFLGRQGILLAAVGAFLLVLWGFGRSLGLPLLFWRASHGPIAEKRMGRFFVGVGVGIFLGAALFVGLLVESAEHEWSRAELMGWLAASSWMAALVLVLIWLVGRYRATSSDGPPSMGLIEAALLPASGGVGLWAFATLVDRLHAFTPAWLGRLVEDLLRALPPPHPTGELLEFHVTAGTLFVLGAGLYAILLVLNRAAGRHVYPAVALSVLLCVVAAAHGFVAYRFPAAQVPIYLLLALAYALLTANFQRATVFGLAEGRGGPPGTLLDDRGVLESWRKRHTDRPVLVVLATDGGGVRAALWTAVVLTKIEETWPGFARHLRLVTGASGGMLGAACWVATLIEDADGSEMRHAAGGAALDREKLLDAVQAGGLSAVASGLVFRDLLPPPLRLGPDRGRCLEQAWEENCAVLAGTVGGLAAGEGAGWRPSLVLTPMVVEDGRRLILSNLDLEELIKNDGPLLDGEHPYSRGGVQLFQRLPAARETLRLSTAVRLQANFPWVLPSTELPPLGPGEPPLRVVDAGYYDETGADLACLWIFRHRDWLRANTGGVLLLQVRDRSLSIDRQGRPRRPRGFLERGFDGLVTPVSAVLRARGATTWYRNDAAVAALARVLNGGVGGKDFFTTAVFELGVKASLTWSLTSAEAATIRANMGEGRNPATLAAVDAWRRR